MSFAMLDFKPFVRVAYRPWLPDSHRIVMHEGCLVARDRRTLEWTIRGIQWHEERRCCPTWTDAVGCRCDVGDE